MLAGLSRYDGFPPVYFVRGDVPAHVEGESFYWCTRGGRFIRHPRAYARVGWSSIVYVPSRRQVVVGVEWLMKHHPNLWAAVAAARVANEIGRWRFV
jgi:hypothetical protein